MAEQVCPPLGTGSVDFNALHDALDKGKDPVKALADATTGGPPLSKAPPAEDKKSAKAPAKPDAGASEGESAA